jgi:hypothetical protein
MLAILPNPGLAIAELGNPGRTRRNPMARSKASYRRAGRLGGIAMRRPRRRVYGSHRVTRGPNAGFYPGFTITGKSRPMARTLRRRHPAVKWSGRKGKRRYNYRTIKGTRSWFSNPGLMAYPKQYAVGFVDALKTIPSAVKKPKTLVIGAAAAAGTYVAGGYLARLIQPLVDKIPGAQGEMGKRIIGGLMPWTTAFLASMVVKNKEMKAAILLGGAIGSAVELAMPGMIGRHRAPPLWRKTGHAHLGSLPE